MTWPLSLLFIGGTGTISASAVELAVARGMNVHVLNRGRNSKGRRLPSSVIWHTADATEPASVIAALGDLHFDAAVNFLTFDAVDAARSIEIFRDRTDHYVHISSASIYHKPIQQVPLVESTLRENRFIPYSRDKIEAEDVLLRAHVDEGFPVTIVRPSHTYDNLNPPLPGGWTIFDRIERGSEIVVHGDGTSLWTLTHAADFAQGLIGLMGNQRAIGEAFHITSNDIYTWDQIYSLVGRAIGVTPTLVHLPSELIAAAAPHWHWSELFLGDIGHSAIFDNSKIARFVPDFSPTRTFVRSVTEMAQLRRERTSTAVTDPEVDRLFDRLVVGYHSAHRIFSELAEDRH